MDKDTPKYIGAVLDYYGDVDQTSPATGNDKKQVEAEALAAYQIEQQHYNGLVKEYGKTHVEENYVMPAYDVYIREREVRKFISAVNGLLEMVSNIADANDWTLEDFQVISVVKEALADIK